MAKVAKVFSVAPIGFNEHVIEVESDATKGLPTLQIVGPGNKAIDEAKERIKSAITNSLLDYPTKRITINLAPAELPKMELIMIFLSLCRFSLVADSYNKPR